MDYTGNTHNISYNNDADNSQPRKFAIQRSTIIANCSQTINFHFKYV